MFPESSSWASGTLEEFRIETSPKDSGECVDQGRAVVTFVWGNPSQDVSGNSSPGRRGWAQGLGFLLGTLVVGDGCHNTV